MYGRISFCHEVSSKSRLLSETQRNKVFFHSQICFFGVDITIKYILLACKRTKQVNIYRVIIKKLCQHLNFLRPFYLTDEDEILNIVI